MRVKPGKDGAIPPMQGPPVQVEGVSVQVEGMPVQLEREHAVTGEAGVLAFILKNVRSHLLLYFRTAEITMWLINFSATPGMWSSQPNINLASAMTEISVR